MAASRSAASTWINLPDNVRAPCRSWRRPDHTLRALHRGLEAPTARRRINGVLPGVCQARCACGWSGCLAGRIWPRLHAVAGTLPSTSNRALRSILTATPERWESDCCPRCTAYSLLVSLHPGTSGDRRRARWSTRGRWRDRTGCHVGQLFYECSVDLTRLNVRPEDRRPQRGSAGWEATTRFCSTWAHWLATVSKARRL